MKAVMLILALGLVLVGCVPTKADPQLCELAKNREPYAGRTVTVEGVLSVSRHGSALVDPSCGLGIGIAWFAEDVPRMRKFNAVAKQSFRQPMLVKARVTGTVRQDTRGSLGLPPTWILRLTKADVLQAYAVSEMEHDRFLDWLDGPHDKPFRLAH